MIVEIAIYHQICLIELNEHNRLQKQYSGFLNTGVLQPETGNYSFINFALETFPEQLPINFKMPHPIRLGQRMEVFMEWALSQEYQILAKNLQIIHEKRTLGEFDFILRSKETNQTIHLEMVYKFYLYRPEIAGSTADKLYGPNAKDQYALKLNKLITHQLPLLFKPEAETYLQDLNLRPENLLQSIYFKAQIFLPCNFSDTIPEFIKESIAGFYFKPHELEFLNKSQNHFYIPHKNDWVAHAADTMLFDEFKNFKQKISAILQEQRSVLFWLFSAETNTFNRHFASWW